MKIGFSSKLGVGFNLLGMNVFDRYRGNLRGLLTGQKSRRPGYSVPGSGLENCVISRNLKRNEGKIDHIDLRGNFGK